MVDISAMGAVSANIGGRSVAWPRARGARRCLFGPPDPEKTRTFLETETERLDSENRTKWNFDFEHERPLDSGRFVWTPIGAEKEKKQTRITDFMRKRKLPSNPEPKDPSDPEEPLSKTRRRFST